MANRVQKNFYSNPAFCQKSEFYNNATITPTTQCIPRQSPIGAQTPLRYLEHNDNNVDEQEFYEEVVVDEDGIVKEKKILVVSSQDSPQKSQKMRYEYIPMQENGGNRYFILPTTSSPSKQNIHYNFVETTHEMLNYPARSKHRYEYIQDEYSPKKSPTRYEYPRMNSSHQQHRYEYLPSPGGTTRGNPIATQKLHEILTTPKKTQIKKQQQHQQMLSPQLQRRPVITSTPTHDPFITPNSSPQKKSKMQQKLNYTLATRQIPDKRYNNTAIVSPICSSPLQTGVYSETTIINNNKSDSWMNLSMKRPPIQATLAVAAVMMTLCGGVTTSLCFYMVSIMGRLYFLDFGTVSGFACLVLGLLGFRTRNCYWLPNRNYISGYIVLSVFSLLTCAGLLILLVMQPRPGTPLADMTSGAVCGISVLSLILASSGVISSYCCKYPPPDNRVEHCVQGFVV